MRQAIANAGWQLDTLEQRAPEKLGSAETFERNKDFMYRLRARELKG